MHFTLRVSFPNEVHWMSVRGELNVPIHVYAIHSCFLCFLQLMAIRLPTWKRTASIEGLSPNDPLDRSPNAVVCSVGYPSAIEQE